MVERRRRRGRVQRERQVRSASRSDRSQQRRPRSVRPDRTWNADVYTSWEFVHSLSLYGRLGYAQTDTRPLIAPVSLAGATRRLRDGVNYGVGLRYDLTQALGLRVEYARFDRYNGDAINAGLLPESDRLPLASNSSSEPSANRS